MKTDIDIDIEIRQMHKHFFLKSYNKENIDSTEDREKQFISKISPYHFWSINEIQISEIIEQIPYFSNHFDILYDYDFLQIGQLNENIIEKLNMNTKEKYLLLEFKKRNFIKCNDFLFQFKNPKKLILHSIDSFTYLLNSLIKLHKNNIYFFNLSFENIVFDMDCGEKPILVDFQNSLLIEKMNEEYITNIIRNSKMSYTCKPFEVHVLFYLICNNLNTISHSFIEEITEIYVKNLTVLNLFSLSFKETFKLLCVHSLEKYVNKPKTFIIQDIIERTKQSWDSYSLSIIYLHIFGNMSRVLYLKETFIGKLTILLSKNINPDFSKRESLEKIQENVDKLFCQFNDWSFVKNISIHKIEYLFSILCE